MVSKGVENESGSTPGFCTKLKSREINLPFSFYRAANFDSVASKL